MTTGHFLPPILNETPGHPWRLLARIALPVLSCYVILSFSACGDSGSNTVNSTRNVTNASSAPVSGQDTAVLLAKDILATNVNPFLNKLPITVEAQEDTNSPPPPIESERHGGNQENTATEVPELPSDPFEGITLSGIAYQDKNAFALVNTANSSRVVREGDVISGANGEQLKVIKIKADRIDIKENGPSGEKRSLLLPNIVGFTVTPNPNKEKIEKDSKGKKAKDDNPATSAADKPGADQPQEAAIETPQEKTDTPRGKRPIINLEE